MMFHRGVFILVLLSVYVLCVKSQGSLPTYNVNINRTTVSGLSSGAYMAVQMHLAYSANINGAGIFAGGPYNCAQGDLSSALTTCMTGTPAPNVSKYVSTANSRSQSGEIDDIENLQDDLVYLFSGTKDTTVKQTVVDALQEFYLNFIPGSGAIEYMNTEPAAHTQPTNYQINTNPCSVSQSPYLSYCQYDGAGDALNHLFNGSLNPLNTGVLSGEVIEFDQSEFYNDPNKIGLATSGFAYVPAACANGASCLLHVAFHGCLQGYETVGYDYINNAGYNEWADTNFIIVLYPQIHATTLNPQNPNGCWDWWGYNNNPSTYDTKSGVQMNAIYSMIQHVSSGYVTLSAPNGLKVTSTTDNSISLSWSAVSGAAGYFVYRDGVVVSSAIQSTSYTDSGLLSGTTYEYMVAGVTSNNSPGALSASVSGTTTGNPPALSPPTGLEISSVSSTSVTIQWNQEVGADSYIVYRNGTEIGNTSSSTYTDTALTPSTYYEYSVAASNSAYTSSLSSSVVIETNSGFSCESYTDNNYDQVQKGRAYTKLGYAYANGSDENMGLYNIFIVTTLSETSPNYYVIGNCSQHL